MNAYALRYAGTQDYVMRSKHGYSTKYTRGDKPVLVSELSKARRLATEVEKRANRNINLHFGSPITTTATALELEIVEFELKELGVQDRQRKVTLAEQRRKRELAAT